MHPATEEAAWDAAVSWARSGLMALCGSPDGPPLVPPLSAPAKLTEVVGEIDRRTTARGRPVRVSWEAALAGRAALLGLTRRGAWSANGTCRLLQAADGELALNLPRPDDVGTVPALTGSSGAEGDEWKAVVAAASESSAAEFVSRARLLGLAAAIPAERAECESYRVSVRGKPRVADPHRSWTVVDLSSLWAGPLAARILAEAGARVVKVEDPFRVDGARLSPSFYSWIHRPSDRVRRVEFNSAKGRSELTELLDSADVVIEASRPRALEQIGLSPDRKPGPDGQVWLSITGYGRMGEAANWTAFGDDAAIAGGLLCRDADKKAMFCGDAIADPLTGLAGALAVLRSLDEGGGQLIDISLSGAAGWFAAGIPDRYRPRVKRTENGWTLFLGDRSEPINERPAGPPLLLNS